MGLTDYEISKKLKIPRRTISENLKKIVEM